MKVLPYFVPIASTAIAVLVTICLESLLATSIPAISQIAGLKDVLQWGLLVAVSLTITMLSTYWQQSRRKSALLEQLQTELNERQQAQQALAKELLRIETLFDKSFDGIVVMDKEGNVLDANPRFAEMLGYTLEEVATLTVFDWDTYLTPEELQQSLQEAVIYHRGVLETQHRRKNGSIYDVEVSYNVVDSEGEILRFCACRDITERKRAEQALQQRETLLRLFSQYVPAGVAMFDRGMGYIIASQRWVDDYQLSSIKSIIGRSHYEIFPEISERWRQIHQRCLAGAIEKCDEDVFIRSDGMQQWIRWEVHPWHTATGEIGGIIIFSEDITLQKQAEQALRRSRDELDWLVQERTQELRETNNRLQQRKRELKTLLENTPDVITRHDRQYRYLYVNPASSQQSGIPLETYLGKKPSELDYPKAITDFWEGSLETVFVTGQMRIDEYQDFNCNPWKTYQTYFVPEFGSGNTVESVITISRDITELRTAEESARQLAYELERSNHELEQFAYIASHDLQEPLRAIASFTQMLAKRYQGKLDAKADTYIEFIVDGTTRMQQQIKDLLSYSRIGRSQLKLQRVDCNTLLEQVKKDLQVPITETQAVITAESLPTITADVNQLGNLLRNLIHNSLKYRSEICPQIHISAKKDKLEVPVENRAQSSANQVQEAWLFSIQDNGIGIESQYTERVFAIFQRLHSSDEYPGTGLGLAICKKIIERHQGRIWVESQLGQGATFFFTIPIFMANQHDISF